jgi:hypothetical protein
LRNQQTLTRYQQIAQEFLRIGFINAGAYGNSHDEV